jgi:periplasmic protein TonB
MARRPAPPAAPVMPLAARRPAPLGMYLFGGLYLLMLATGFAVGFRAGSPTPTSPKSTLVASARTTTTAARPGPTPPPQAGPTPTVKAPEPKAPSPTEPDPEPMPEPPPEKKPEPKPEPRKSEPKNPSKAGPEVAFAQVASVFKDKCTICHGGVEPKGGLDLRSAKAAIAGGDSGPGVKPGDPDNSPIWQQIADGTMPPKNKPKLTAEEKKLIKEWIASGAK